MSTRRLESHAEKLKEAASRSAEFAIKNPGNPWAAIIAKNQKYAAEEVHHQAINYRLAEAGQLVDFRFFGLRANGSIGLDSFIKIFDPISRALKHAAQKILTGVDDKRVNNLITDQLNLKLAGVSYGSTRIVISGSIAPDLTGHSLLETTLEKTFGVLNSPNDEFYESVDAIGGKAAVILLESISAIDSAGFGAEFSWKSAKGEQIWYGQPDELLRLKTLLHGFQEPTVYSETLSGYVSKIFESGKIELRAAEGKIPISYPLNLIEQVQSLTISAPATLEVLTSQYYDSVRKQEVYKRTLVNVLP